MVVVGHGVGLEERLFGLAPRAKMIAGGIAVAIGATTAVLFDAMGVLWFGSVFACLLGAAVSLAGLREMARQREVDAAIARAREEWEDLVRDVRLARRTGGNVARLLQQRGYREFAVRRWIVRQCEAEDGTGGGAPPVS